MIVEDVWRVWTFEKHDELGETMRWRERLGRRFQLLFLVIVVRHLVQLDVLEQVQVKARVLVGQAMAASLDAPMYLWKVEELLEL